MKIYVGLFGHGHQYEGFYQRIEAETYEEAWQLMYNTWARPFEVCEQQDAYILLTGEKQMPVTLKCKKAPTGGDR